MKESEITEIEVKKESPLQWLSQLGHGLQNTQARSQTKTLTLEAGLSKFTQLLLNLKNRNGALYWAANGGSASIASHLSQDYLNKLHLRSYTLFDPSMLTCISNDYGYEKVFSLPLSKLSRPGDMLIAISSSGKSKNILNAVEAAQMHHMQVVSFSGFENENPLWQSSTDLGFYYPSQDYGLVEIGHSALLHSIIDKVSQMQGGQDLFSKNEMKLN